MQLLVRVVDKINPKDPVKNAQLTKAGDVIVYKPDGQEWGTEELNNPDWRIIHVPDMTEEHAISLVSSELPVDLHNPSHMLQRRAMKLDIKKLDNMSDGKLLGPRQVHGLMKAHPNTPVFAIADILKHQTLKPSLPDHTKIGPPDTVIGA